MQGTPRAAQSQTETAAVSAATHVSVSVSKKDLQALQQLIPSGTTLPQAAMLAAQEPYQTDEAHEERQIEKSAWGGPEWSFLEAIMEPACVNWLAREFLGSAATEPLRDQLAGTQFTDAAVGPSLTWKHKKSFVSLAWWKPLRHDLLIQRNLVATGLWVGWFAANDNAHLFRSHMNQIDRLQRELSAIKTEGLKAEPRFAPIGGWHYRVTKKQERLLKSAVAASDVEVRWEGNQLQLQNAREDEPLIATLAKSWAPLVTTAAQLASAWKQLAPNVAASDAAEEESDEVDDDDSDEVDDRVAMDGRSRSVILYGPPGTGKTHATRKRAIELCRPNMAKSEAQDEQSLFEQLRCDGRIEFVCFHQSYGYEEFIEGIRPVLNGAKSLRYELHDGVLKRIALRAAAEGLRRSLAAEPGLSGAAGASTATQEDVLRKLAGDEEYRGYEWSFANVRQYVLIIDEINRGNISKILGEMITLLEDDRRIAQPNAITLPLMYSSGKMFALPPNLHIIGTMNTADRSIALLDVALRRRFRFEELMPDSSQLVDPSVGPLAAKMLDMMNARIRFLYDRDHQIGHAYFMRCTTHDDLREAFVGAVIPLLAEYFYNAWDRVAMVLGCNHVDVKAGMLVRTTVSEKATLGFDHDSYEDRVEWALNPAFVNATKPLQGFFDQLLSGATPIGNSG